MVEISTCFLVTCHRDPFSFQEKLISKTFGGLASLDNLSNETKRMGLRLASKGSSQDESLDN